MEHIALELRVTRLIINGHIPLPCTLMEAAQFLGTHHTSSLPLAVLMSPAMGETTGRRSGLSRRKTQARYIRMGARSCARRQTAASLSRSAAANSIQGVADLQVRSRRTYPRNSHSLRRNKLRDLRWPITSSPLCPVHLRWASDQIAEGIYR